MHEEETESDYLTAVDDLKRDADDSGADTIQEAELTSGLFYGYVVIDVPGLVSNTTGCRARRLARSEDQPHPSGRGGAQSGLSDRRDFARRQAGYTAPYGRAELVLVEAGDRQPRSLGSAFRKPVSPHLANAMTALGQHLSGMDRLYETGEARRALHLTNEELPSAQRGSLREIAEWAKATVLKGAKTWSAA